MYKDYRQKARGGAAIDQKDSARALYTTDDDYNDDNGCQEDYIINGQK